MDALQQVRREDDQMYFKTQEKGDEAKEVRRTVSDTGPGGRKHGWVCLFL